MALLDVRKNFVQFSGRYDLVIDRDEWQDDGADFFIQAGLKWLDRFAHIRKAEARNFQTIIPGSYYVMVPDCRAVHAVYVSDGCTKRKLSKTTYEEFRCHYPKDSTRIGRGVPCEYTLISLRSVPEIQGATVIDMYGDTIYTEAERVDYVLLTDELTHEWTVMAGNALELLTFRNKPAFVSVPIPSPLFPISLPALMMTAIDDGTPMYLSVSRDGELRIEPTTILGATSVGNHLDMRATSGFMNILTVLSNGTYQLSLGEKLPPGSPDYNFEGVLFNVPNELPMSIEVHGVFYSPKLVVDTDTNFWTEEQPFILVLAACRALEISYRNTAGVADWTNSIREEIFGMELDFADMESAEFNQMIG